MKSRGVVVLLGLLVVAGSLGVYVVAGRSTDRPPADGREQATPASRGATEPDCGAELPKEDASPAAAEQQADRRSQTQEPPKEGGAPAGPPAEDPLAGLAPCGDGKEPE